MGSPLIEKQGIDLIAIDSKTALSLIASHVSALANSQGGTLIFGLKPNGKIIGVFLDEVKEIWNRLLQEFTSQPFDHSTSSFIEKNSYLFRVDIHSSQKRIQAKSDSGEWKTYIRLNNQTLLSNKITEKAHQYSLRSESLAFDLDKIEQVKGMFVNMEQGLSLSQCYKKCQNIVKPKELDKLLAYMVSEKSIYPISVGQQIYFKLS